MTKTRASYRILFLTFGGFWLLCSCTSTKLSRQATVQKVVSVDRAGSYSAEYLAALNPATEPVVVFPDGYIFSNVCHEFVNLETSGSFNSPLPLEIEDVLPEVKTIRQLCADVTSQQIDLDIWWKSLWAILNKPSDCGNCKTKRITPPELLPANYPVYLMFLVPTPDWDEREFLRVWQAYKSFGDSIGPRNLAIWFTTGGIAPDVGRSKFYCDRLRLNYNDGPYIIVSSVRPDNLTDTSSVTLIRLKNVAPERVVSILNILEQDLRLGVHPRESLLIYEEIRQRLFTLGERNAELLKEIFVSALN